jgi:hypothetical protein
MTGLTTVFIVSYCLFTVRGEAALANAGAGW